MKPHSNLPHLASLLLLMTTLPHLALPQVTPIYALNATRVPAYPTTVATSNDSTSSGPATRNPNVAAVQLDLADRMAAELSEWTSEISQEGEIPAGITSLRLIRGAFKIIREIGNFNKKLSIGTNLFTYVVSMLLKSETEVLAESMMRRFQQVNQKLSNLQRQLDKATARFQVVQEASEALVPYRLCHNSVRNGALKLSDILKRMEVARTKHNLARLAEEYTTWYETSELDNHLMNMYRAATRETTSTIGTNLFHSYAMLHDCSTTKLIHLMLGVAHDFELGSELQLAYQFFRNGAERAASQFQRSRSNLYELRTAFDRRIWYCLENTVVMAKSAARKLLAETSNQRLTVASAASHVLAGLETRFHTFNWAVALGVSELLPSSAFETENFFQLETNPGLLVSFSDSNQALRCSDANFTITRLHFRCPTAACAIATSPGIIGSRSCPGFSIIGAENSDDWLASLSQVQGVTCSSPDACNRRGVCRHTPGLTRPLCLCDPEYQGDRCSTKDDPTTVSATLIADMRDTVGHFTGVQTTVDVYYKLLDVQAALARELRGLTACTELIRIVNSDTISEAMYMADTNAQLLNGQRNLDQFGELMHTHVRGRNLDYFLKSLLERLLGVNRFGLTGNGIIHLFKRCWVNAHGLPPCSERYAQSVQTVMTSLAMMDEAVGESLLTYFSWKHDRTTPADKLVAGYLTNEYKNRTAQFRDHWNAQSCPALMNSGRPLGPGLWTWEQRFCNSSHSYEGLELNVSCTGLRQPRVSKIACIRGSDGSLKWSHEPQCDSVWAEWSGWSSCSVTCGSGHQKRYRCLGNNCMRRDEDTRPCSRIDCCVSQYGEGGYFRCRNNGCISKERVCDGIQDCSDGTDEDSCDFVRAGQLISLRASPFQAYSVNCYCASRCLIQPVHCYMKYCANWHTGCYDEYARYNIYSPERGINEAIHSGDTIGLMYDWGRTKWLSCTWRDSTKCTTRDCPGGDVRHVSGSCGGEKFIIYSVENTGRCRGQNNCAGRPIRRGERVALRNPSGWLSAPGMDTEVRIRNCLQYRSLARAPGCSNEVFVIHN